NLRRLNSLDFRIAGKQRWEAATSRLRRRRFRRVTVTSCGHVYDVTLSRLLTSSEILDARTAPFSRWMKIRTALVIARLTTSMGMTQSKRSLAKYQSLSTIEEIGALRR
ncbi:hypothetical protein LINPERPRIM_LOCUS11764, partial [Linum perenne]